MHMHIIHVTHSQGLKGGWSESVIIAGEEVGKEAWFASSYRVTASLLWVANWHSALGP